MEEESSKVLENAKQLYPGVGIDSLGTLEVDDVVQNMKNKQDPIFLTAFARNPPHYDTYHSLYKKGKNKCQQR